MKNTSGTAPGTRPHEVEVGAKGGAAHGVVLVPHTPPYVQRYPEQKNKSLFFLLT